jgi:hypothetical protein
MTLHRPRFPPPGIGLRVTSGEDVSLLFFLLIILAFVSIPS